LLPNQNICIELQAFAFSKYKGSSGLTIPLKIDEKNDFLAIPYKSMVNDFSFNN
jgi:hypothetical protein